MDPVCFFMENGYVLIENMFSPNEVEVLKEEFPKFLQSEGAVHEKDNQVLRSINLVHKTSRIFNEVCRHPKLISLAKKILLSDVYVHQFKINLKQAFDGDVWEWHQDHLFWLKEDGMLKPDAFTAAIFLTESNQFNAPMMLIPKSHSCGTIDATPNATGWKSTLLAKLKYSLPNNIIAEQAFKNGIYSAKAKPGSVLLFHSNILHASTKNISPYDRVMLMISYNSVNNKLQNVENYRPEFLASRDFTPLTPIKNSVFFNLEKTEEYL